MKATIKEPTVADFITFLSQLPADAPLRMIDPDTYWTISVFHIEDGQQPDPKTIWLSAKYQEMAG